MLCSVSSFVLQGDNKKQREREGEREQQLFRKSNKPSISRLDTDVCSCLEGYWTDLCAFVCFRMYRPSQHSVCGAWHSSQGCVCPSCFLTIITACVWTFHPPPTPSTSRGLSPRQPWTADCVCRPSSRRSWILQVCVCVWCVYRCSFVQQCMT